MSDKCIVTDSTYNAHVAELAECALTSMQKKFSRSTQSHCRVSGYHVLPISRMIRLTFLKDHTSVFALCIPQDRLLRGRGAVVAVKM